MGRLIIYAIKLFTHFSMVKLVLSQPLKENRNLSSFGNDELDLVSCLLFPFSRHFTRFGKKLAIQHTRKK